jgi:hypothetical protein
MTADSKTTEQASMTLVCSAGSMFGQSIALSGGRMLIGRAEDCDLRVDAGVDVKVSGRHAVIEQDDKGYTFTDLGSTNGSLVNGQPVQANKPVRLSPGAKIVLGEDAGQGTVAFTLTLAGEPVAAAREEIATTCGSCAEQFGAPRSMMGRKVACPSCGAQVEVPISTKLFSGSGQGSAGSAPASQANDKDASPGLLGKMKKAVHNFREKREVQDQLKLLTDQASPRKTKAESACAALGLLAWNEHPEAVSELPGGSDLQAKQQEMAEIEQRITETHERLDDNLDKGRASDAAWSKKCEASKAQLEKKQETKQASASKHQDAEQSLRDALNQCLASAMQAGDDAKALCASDLTDAEAGLKSVIDKLGSAVEAAEAGRAEVNQRSATFAEACAELEQAEAELTSAEQAHADNESQAKAQAAEHAEAARAAQGELDGHERNLAALRDTLAPAYRALGEHLVEQQGAGVVGEEVPELAEAAAAHARYLDLKTQIDTLQARLQSL